ncbi:MAG: hypothetical protein VYB71_02675 [Chloroflexota bacterium]|nr:hypothetical protein [Chloroflexota bacterium]
MEFNLAGAITLFLGSAVVVVLSAIALAKAGDTIASNTRLGHLWVGSLLIAGATSLPELVTNIAAVRINNPGLAAGNILGANMLNVSNLALIVALFGGRHIFQQLTKGQEILAIEAFILTALATAYVVIGSSANWFGVTPGAVSILIVYLIGSRILYKTSAGETSRETEVPEHTLRWGWVVFLMAGLFVSIAATALAISADQIADKTGISASFVGALAVAFVTTLPELTVGVTAIRIGAPEMAIAGLYGSNAFNIAILAVADLAYFDNSLFGALDDSHVVAGGFAVLLMGIGVIQMRLRRRVIHFSLKEPSTAGIVMLYVVGILFVFQAG